MAKSIQTQVEEQFGIDETALQVVIYFSDPSWSNAVVYGPEQVAQMVQADMPDSTVTSHPLSELPSVPSEGYVREASVYGLTSGKMLLVPGRPV